MSLYRMRTQVAVALEGTKGTAETLEAGDAIIMAEDVNPDYSPEQIERNVAYGDMSKTQSTPGAPLASLSFRVEIKGSGTIDTAPAIGLLLQACGTLEGITASTSVAYTLDSDEDNRKSVTMGVLVDGSMWSMYGAQGNAVFSMDANQHCYINFNFVGIFEDFAPQALFSPTYETTKPAKWKNAAFTLNFGGGAWTSAVLDSFSLDLGNEVSVRPNANATNGLEYARIGDHRVTGTMNLDQVLPATQDMFSHLETPTLASLSCVLGSDAGNILTLTAPKLQVLGLPSGDREGLAIWNMPFALRRNAGDDELVITFT